jgi:hypothetical protein
MQLSECEPGTRAIWNWKGGVQVIVRRRVGHQVEVQVLEKAGTIARVFPGSLRSIPAPTITPPPLPPERTPQP